MWKKITHWKIDLDFIWTCWRLYPHFIYISVKLVLLSSLFTAQCTLMTSCTGGGDADGEREHNAAPRARRYSFYVLSNYFWHRTSTVTNCDSLRHSGLTQSEQLDREMNPEIKTEGEAKAVRSEAAKQQRGIRGWSTGRWSGHKGTGRREGTTAPWTWCVWSRGYVEEIMMHWNHSRRRRPPALLCTISHIVGWGTKHKGNLTDGFYRQNYSFYLCDITVVQIIFSSERGGCICRLAALNAALIFF